MPPRNDHLDIQGVHQKYRIQKKKTLVLHIGPKTQDPEYIFSISMKSVIIHSVSKLGTNYVLLCFPVPHANIQFVPNF